MSASDFVYFSSQSENVIEHIGCRLRISKQGMKLHQDNYVLVSNKSSFRKGLIYDDYFCDKHLSDVIINYKLNMSYFQNLDNNIFNDELSSFIRLNPYFVQVCDLNEFKEKQGYYLIVLDDYSQMYLGTSSDIYRRVKSHWHKRKEFDRLIFGGVYKSKLSIDSFRALDTTRIYAYVTNDTFSKENRFINEINEKYLCNRTVGGLLDKGIVQAISGRKTREL